MNVFALALSMWVLFTCGSNTENQEMEEGNLEAVDSPNTVSNDPSSTQEETVENYLKPKYIRSGQDRLIIHGKDIWVRDEPATGKVVMKLNEGDKCTVLKEGFVEMIRGDADYWYKIEFNGQEGWVFGSQTSYKNQSKPIVADAANALWEKFKKHYLDWVTKANEMQGLPNEDNWKYVFENNGETFKVNWEGEGPTLTTYSTDNHSNSSILLYIKTELQEGAAGFTNSWKTYVGLLFNNSFTLFRSLDLKGKVEKLMPLNSDEFVIFTYQDTGDGVVMFHESYYTIYYINVAQQSVRKIGTEIGKVKRDGHIYTTKDNLAVQSSFFQYSKDATTFTLNEVRYKEGEKDNQMSYELYDTLQTQYLWNDKKKTYVKE